MTKVPDDLNLLLSYLATGTLAERQSAAIELSRIQSPEIVPALQHALTDPDSTVRANAASGLGHNQARDMTDDLIALLKDDDDIVRERAATALAQLGEGRAIEPLIDALDDSGTWARNRIIYVLGASGDSRAVEPLIVMLDYPDPSTQGVAAWALGSLQDSRAIEPLLALLQDDDASVRGNAAWGLGEMAQPALIPPLIERLQDESPQVRAKAAWALGTLHQSTGDTTIIEPLITLLDDYTEIQDTSAHQFVCQYAAESLGQIDNPQAQDAVSAWKPIARQRLLPRRIADMIRALQHPDAETRQTVFQELQAIGDPAIPALIEALQRNDLIRIRQGAAQALGLLGDSRAVHALIMALADPDSGVWSQSVAALANLGKPAEKALRPIISSPKERVRLGAGIALWRIAREDKAFKLILQALQHQDVVIRGSAITSLWQQPDERAVATLQIQLSQESGTMAHYILQALDSIGTPAAQTTIANWLAQNRPQS